MKSAFLAAVAAAAAQSAAATDPAATVGAAVIDNGSPAYQWKDLAATNAAGDATYATNSRHFQLATFGTISAGTKLEELYPKVLNEDGKDVSALLGASAKAAGKDVTLGGVKAYAVAVDAFNFPEGQFVFSRAGSSVESTFSTAATTVIIDRTAPASMPFTYDGDLVYTGAAASVTVPLDKLFSDNVSKAVKLVSATPLGDAAGFSLDGDALVASTVTGVAGRASFKIVAEDDAANRAEAVFSIPIYTKMTPSLSVYDGRGTGVSSSGTLMSGSAASMTNGKMVFNVVATFPETVEGVEAEDLAVTSVTKSSVGKPTASSNGRVWTFPVTFEAVPGSATFEVKADAVTRKVAGQAAIANDASNTVTAKGDSEAPMAASDAALPAAILGAPYFAYFPLGGSAVLADGADGSAQHAVELTGASANVPVGLSFASGVQGMAALSGTPSSRPTATCGSGKARGVTMTMTGRDQAGNSQTVDVCVPVAEAGASTSLKLARSALSFVEDLEATKTSVAVDAAATYTGEAASRVVVYLESPDASNDEETLTATAPTDTDLSEFTQNKAMVGMIELSVKTGSISAAQVQSFLRSVMYSNTKTAASSGSRTVRVVVHRSSDDAVVAAASRTVSVTTKNSAPVVSGLPAAVEFVEGSDGVPAVGDKIKVADADDDYLTAATVSLATKDGTGYRACDAARDMLTLSTEHSSSVVGAWDPASCTLTLKPIAGWAAPVTDFQSALAMVMYKNKDGKNPANYKTDDADRTRAVSVTVTDAASAGKDLTKAPTGGKVASAATGKGEAAYPLTISLVDDAPKVDMVKAFAEGGFLYEADPAARVTLSDDASVSPTVGFRARKFVLRMDGKTTSAADFTLTFNLAKNADGTYGAGGAISDPDNSGASFSSDWNSPATATAELLSGAMGVAVKAGGVSYDSATGKLSVTLTVDSQKDYSETATLKLTLAESMNPIFLGLDLMKPACPKDIEVKDNGERANAYPAASACFGEDGESLIAATNVDPAVGADITVGSWTAMEERFADMAKAHEEAGSSAMIRINGMRAERQAARGIYRMSVPKDAFSAVSNVDMNAKPPSTDILSRLPTTARGLSLDGEMALQLSPAGQTFSKPVQVCIFVGDVPAGSKYELSITSQVDPKDASKGFTEWSSMSGQTYDASTGLLCGETTHFSVVGPMLVPVPQTPTQQKTFAMGASCPNDCSGKGYCRETGKCVCYSGFEGYDCSLRACPAGESWDSADGVVHKPAECSSRGACNRKTGVCGCYDGFEGAACERVSCPSGCSGHGKCRLLSELPKARQAGYSSWEVTRVQVCQCDGGYTGADCSLRTCPFGDDPETICVNDKRQVQTITLDFGTLPSTLLNNELPASAMDTDVALTFTTASGANYTTPRVEGIFDSAVGKDNLITALKSLPAFAVSDVSVSSSGAATSPKVTYSVTFDDPDRSMAFYTGASMTRDFAAANVAATTVAGNQALFTCPTIAGTTYVAGCSGPACRPQFRQPRILDVVGGADVTVAPGVTLEQPEELTAGDKAISGKWGVVVTVTVNGNPGDVQSYSVASSVYEQGAGASMAEQVLPPVGLRKNVPIAYGLHLDFADSVAPGTYTFRWRLPTCEVKQTQAADPDFESLECSRRGVCDRKTGECVCFSGYSGFSCSQQTVVV